MKKKITEHTQKLLDIPEKEIMSSGHLACPGCGATLSMRLALKALGPKTILSMPACCWSVVDGPFPHSCAGVPLLHTAFETAAAAASGIRATLDIKGDKETTVVAWGGDGGTLDIGIQAFSGAAERNENFIYVCYDNEAYMNTGIQRSSATPEGAWTTTTPERTPKSRPKKDLMGIMAAHRIPYAATATVAFPELFIKVVKKAKKIKGTRLIHILSPCPPGWRMSSVSSIKMARLAVQTKTFPLYEIIDGERYNLLLEPEGIPVKEYLKQQGRFRHLKAKDYKRIQKNVDKAYDRLFRRVEESKEFSI